MVEPEFQPPEGRSSYKWVTVLKTRRRYAMLDFNSLFELSRYHCVAICAFLVPANLLTTLHTLIRVGLRHYDHRLNVSITLAIAFALLMVLHVATWLMVGVVMIPTFVLLLLGVVCLGINSWAIAHRNHLQGVLQYLSRKVRLALAGTHWAIALPRSHSSTD